MNRMVDARAGEDGVKVVKGDRDHLIPRPLGAAKDGNEDALLDVPQAKGVVGGTGGQQFVVLPIDLEKVINYKIEPE